MTNVLFSLATVLATNWTLHYEGTNQLGYLTTNQVAQVVYNGKTNETLLESNVGNVALWRPTTFLSLTNYAWPFQLTNIVVTNKWWFSNEDATQETKL